MLASHLYNDRIRTCCCANVLTIRTPNPIIHVIDPIVRTSMHHSSSATISPKFKKSSPNPASGPLPVFNCHHCSNQASFSISQDIVTTPNLMEGITYTLYGSIATQRVVVTNNEYAQLLQMRTAQQVSNEVVAYVALSSRYASLSPWVPDLASQTT